MYIKICGIRDANTAEHIVSAGADAIGVVMSEKSPRHVTAPEAAAVVSAARRAQLTSPGRRSVDTVLVVREMPAVEAAQLAADLGFDVLQLHGRYTHEDFAAAQQVLPRVWRATSLARHPDLKAGEFSEERLLIDGSAAGSGQTWDLEGLARVDTGPEWILAGGLSPETVASSIELAKPWGIDVSSGVESSPGVKDLQFIDEFVRLARAASK